MPTGFGNSGDFGFSQCKAWPAGETTYGQRPAKNPALAGPGSSVGCASAWHADGRGIDPRVRQQSFVEIGHEIMSTAILSLPLIQVGQLKECALSTG